MNLSTKPVLKELRFLLCPNGPGSAGLRSFLNKNLYKLHNNQDKVSVLVRECDSIEAAIVARYSKYNLINNVKLFITL